MKRPFSILIAVCMILTVLTAGIIYAGAEPAEMPSEVSGESSAVPEASTSVSQEIPSEQPSSELSSDEMSGESSESELPSEESVPEEESSLPDESESISIDWGEVSAEVSYAPSRNYTLNVTAGKGGRVNLQVNGVYAPNEKVDLSAEADEGYVFSRWKSSGGVIANAFSAKTEFYMPVADARVEAVFVKKGEESKQELSSEIQESVTVKKVFRMPWKLTYSIIFLTLFTAAGIAVLTVIYWKKRNRK